MLGAKMQIWSPNFPISFILVPENFLKQIYPITSTSHMISLKKTNSINFANRMSILVAELASYVALKNCVGAPQDQIYVFPLFHLLLCNLYFIFFSTISV